MPSSRLNLNQAKAFYYAAKNASYAGAANELSVTPRAVRLQMDALEARRKVKLVFAYLGPKVGAEGRS